MYTIIRMPIVIQYTGLGRSTIYKKIADNTFPKPISLSSKAVGWLKSDVDKWIQERIKQAANLK